MESCAAGLVKELVREVAEDSYHEAVLAARAHRSEQVCGTQCECVWCTPLFICMYIVSARLTYIVLRTYVHLSFSHTHTHAHAHTWLLRTNVAGSIICV